jgi:hypothetical protein
MSCAMDEHDRHPAEQEFGSFSHNDFISAAKIEALLLI